MTDGIQDEWQQLVKQSRQAAAAPPPPPLQTAKPLKWKLPLLFILSLVALALWFQGTLNPWPEEPTPEEIRVGQEASLVLTLQSITDYAAFHGRYPKTIEEVVHGANAGIDYRVTGNGVELRMVGADGREIVVRGK